MTEPTLTPAITFDWRPTTDAARVYAIHRIAIAKAPAGMVRPDTLGHFEQHVAAQGLILGCFLDNGEMIAYGVLALRSETVEHMAAMLGAQRERFCVFDGASALPEWRGFGLHVAGVVERIRYAATLGLTQSGATVSPHNIRSVRGLLRAGMVVRGFARMYGGLSRLVLQHDTLMHRRVHASGQMRVVLSDLDGHQHALAAGLTGYACSQDTAGNWVIDYGS